MRNNLDKTKARKTYRLFNDRVEIKLFGRPFDWSITNHKLGSIVLNRIAKIAKDSEVKAILAPRPSMFNAKICDSKDLSDIWNVSKGMEKVEIWRGCDADGVLLSKGQAFWLSSADCPTIVIADIKTNKVIAAHAGRNCLMDRLRIDGNGKSRKHESVIDSIMAKLRSSNIKNVRVFIVNGIGPNNFIHHHAHTEHGESNKKMTEDIIKRWGRQCVVGDPKLGKLSLLAIIRSQLAKYSIKSTQIKSATIDTFEDRDAKGNYIWWSNRRGDKLKRNGVMVIRKK